MEAAVSSGLKDSIEGTASSLLYNATTPIIINASSFMIEQQLPSGVAAGKPMVKSALEEFISWLTGVATSADISGIDALSAKAAPAAVNTVASGIGDALHRHLLQQSISHLLGLGSGAGSGTDAAVFAVRTSLSALPALVGNETREPGKGYLSLSFRGDVADGRIPHQRLPLPSPAPLPALDETADDHHIQMVISNYSIASLLHAPWSQGLMMATLPPSSVPQPLNMSDAWESIVPGLPQVRCATRVASCCIAARISQRPLSCVPFIQPRVITVIMTSNRS